MKAAVRVLGIVETGFDVEPIGELRNRHPSQIRAKKVRPVPGVDGAVSHLFGVSRVLSWIAGQRSEVAEDLEWRSQVQDLMEKLTSRSTESPQQPLAQSHMLD